MVLQEYEKKHLKLVRKSAAECCLFLKKDGSFPLAEAGKIAAFGAGVRHTVKGGTGSGEVNSRFSVNVEKGLTRAGFQITSTVWLDGYDQVLETARKEFVAQIRREAREHKQIAALYSMGKAMPQPEYELELTGSGEACIYVLSRDSGEGADRQPIKGDVKLTDTEVRDILELNEKFDKFMLVLNVGGVVDLSPVAQVKNILCLSQLGVVTGYVLADILLGKANPSGKLATTWAAWEDYCTEGTIGDKNETLYKEGIYVGYRYFDTIGRKALYPFGFGLSYSEFALTDSNVSVADTLVTVTVNAENTGAMAGKEVVQVYVSLPDGKLDQPYQVLAGWKKTGLLAPGGQEQVSVTFDLKNIAGYDTETASYILEQGSYVIRVGNSSVSTVPTAILKLDETVTVLSARNCLGTPEFEDYKPEKIACALPEGLEEIKISASAFAGESVDYDPEYEIDPRVEEFTVEELALMSIGNFDPKAGFASVIGAAGKSVPGAAGETAESYKKNQIPVLVMADGPAGLRLNKDYFINKKGLPQGLNNSMLPESIFMFLGTPEKLVLKAVSGMGRKPKKEDILHIYATAIPIGTALAQAFNDEMTEALGDMVGTEMEMFGIHLWLAPALNIHRSILCGRNFEYYSEDPLVSGRVAAAITRGVQKHKSCGTTIKHYAANNAETNRYANNSQVSERAMREIYLKGFGVCVRESQPHAVMTSYNLLNGTHTAEHRGLLEDVLRCEYGYQGIIMTDWVVQMMIDKESVHRNSLAGEVAKAGGDLFMPGVKFDYDHMLKALQDGSLSMKQIMINVSRVIRLAERLAK